MLTEPEIRAKVRALKRFYNELLNYAIINALLIMIWFLFERNTHFWPKYVIVIWGFALIFKACRLGLIPLLFPHLSFLNAEWEEKKVEELMKKCPLQHKIPLKTEGHEKKKKPPRL